VSVHACFAAIPDLTLARGFRVHGTRSLPLSGSEHPLEIQMKKIVLVAAAMSLSACGALFNGGPEDVMVSSNPAGAEVWVDGTNRGITPATLQLAKDKSHTITLRRAGYQEQTVTIDRRLSTTYLILDILGGLVPVIVDAATGSWYVLETDNVNVNLVSNTAMSGQLTPEQLGAVRLGASVGDFITVQK